MGLDAAADRLTTPDEALLTAHGERLNRAQAMMRQFHIQGVPALVAGRGVDRRPVSANALYGGFDALVAELRAA